MSEKLWTSPYIVNTLISCFYHNWHCYGIGILFSIDRSFFILATVPGTVKPYNRFALFLKIFMGNHQG